MVEYTEQEAKNASYFKRYNCRRDTEPDSKDIQQKWTTLQKIVNPDRGGDVDEACHVNEGKEVLLDAKKREEYIKALVHWNLDDGLVVDPDYDRKLRLRIDESEDDDDAPVPYVSEVDLPPNP